MEPFEDRCQIRYRIDGVIHEQPTPPQRLLPAIVSRIKILADLDIAERRLPQDGRIKTHILGQEIDVRVSILPTLHGEAVVMRLLNQSSIQLSLEDLGFTRDQLDVFEKAIRRPHGMVLSQPQLLCRPRPLRQLPLLSLVRQHLPAWWRELAGRWYGSQCD